MALYENIKKRRLELNMSQAELAKLMGYADKSMIAKIEAGKVDLTQSKIKAAAIALHTTQEALFDGEEEQKDTVINSLVAGVAKLTPENKEKLLDYLTLLLQSQK